MTQTRWINTMIAVLACLTAALSYRFTALGLDAAFAVMGEHLDERRVVFALHVIFAPIALVLGALQFSKGLRARWITAHRWLGRAYALCIAISGMAGLILSFGALERPVAGLGFGLLALLWLLCTAQAVLHVRSGQIAKHRIWMMRSYALSLAAVTLRLELPVLIGAFGLSYAEASNYVAWACWLPNLALLELYLAKRS